MSMFCYQCEQSAKGTGCTTVSVCGKDPDVAALQDLIIYAGKGISQYAHRARQLGAIDKEIDEFLLDALFITVTNVNFDKADHVEYLRDAGRLIGKAKEMYLAACQKAGKTPEKITGPAEWVFVDNLQKLLDDGDRAGVLVRKIKVGEDIAGVENLILFGLKGLAAYAHHAQVLGTTDKDVYGFIHECMSFLSDTNGLDKLLPMALKTGEVNFKVMEMLDSANTGAYGHPVPTEVLITPIKGKAILISGHDLKDLEELLKQTEGKGINIYTHGEMLPAHGYPGLKKYKHLAGNYGTAWQNQQKEFEAFPGAILMTTNCLMEPRKTYKHRVFNTGLVGFDGCEYVTRKDFSKVIECALNEKGFTEDAPKDTVLAGFGHNAVLSVAPQVIDAVKTGKIKHFFLVGGCDGAKPGRNYYTDFVDQAPQDTVVLTLACGKFRFFDHKLGDIGGIPRLLDVGQCNDSYSAVQIALALSKAFNTDVNSLPLSLILSWYEQKAVAVLLTLLHLGIKNIRLGPTLPAFVTKPVLDVLVEKFAIKPITSVEQDMKDCMAGH